MASVLQREPSHVSNELVDAVQECIEKLGERDRWIIRAVYVWGSSYSQLADMMGYRSKDSSHKATSKALANLKMILEIHPVIIRLRNKEQYRNMEQTWADASWQKIRAISKATKGEFMPEIFNLGFGRMGRMVRDGEFDTLADVCWGIASEAVRGLDELGQWDEEKMQDILCAKQHDYGHENINAFGMVGIAVRLSDKIARYNNLSKTDSGNKVSGETLIDTLVDMVGYGIIASMHDDGTFQLPLQDGTY